LYEDSKASGVNGDQSDNSVERAGAAYVFTDLGPSPRLVIVPDPTGGNFIRLDGVSGWAYSLERATTMAGPWGIIDTQIAPASGRVEYYDFNPGDGQAFYRVAVDVPAE